MPEAKAVPEKRGGTMTLNIPGLVAVVAPTVGKTPVGTVSAADLDRALRFDASWERVEIEGIALEAVLQVQEKCQFFANVGLNPDLVGVFNFELAAIDTVLIGNQHPNPVSAGISLVFVHKKTREIVVADAAGRFGKVYDHSSTAHALRRAAQGDGRGSE